MGYGGAGFFLFRSFRRRRAEADDFATVKGTARGDLVGLAEDVQELEQRVEGYPEAQRDYDAALEQYSRASGAFDRARSPQQLAPVAEALDEGRYLMASAEARLAGGRPPERRPACFFDPRHGPSVREVEWSPDGGQPRLVPALRRRRAADRGGTRAQLAAGARRRADDAVLGRRPDVRRLLRRLLPGPVDRRDAGRLRSVSAWEAE